MLLKRIKRPRQLYVQKETVCSSLELLQSSIKLNVLAEVVPEVRDSRNEGALVLPGPALNGRHLQGMSLSMMTQRTCWDMRWWEARVKWVTLVGPDLVHHAQCSNVTSVPEVAVHNTIAHT